MENIPYSKAQLMQANIKLLRKNRRYREALFEIREVIVEKVDYITRSEIQEIIDTALEEGESQRV